MTTIKIPTIYIKKLKELGLYDEWFQCIKEQYNHVGYCGINPESIYHSEWLKACTIYRWASFILFSFNSSSEVKNTTLLNAGCKTWADVAHNFDIY